MGVDVSKAELVAVIWPERERRAVANTPEGWQALSAWARSMSVRRVGLEASGGYERGAAEARAQAREDRVRNQGYDAEGQRELETADSGYEPRFGPKPDYQAGYRAGWRRGYPEGWRQP
jgi:hypothetical protein